MDIHKIYGLLLPYFRRKRMDLFDRLFKPEENTRILDVGGTEFNWSFLPVRAKVTLLNPDFKDEGQQGQFIKVRGDGRDLPFADQEFDIVYSNSVIEHVGQFEDQKAFASEVMRVGKTYFVQTPNRSFFLEPHLMTPFIHFLPKTLQLKMAPFTARAILGHSNRAELEDLVATTRLLSSREMEDLFPDSVLSRERFFGLAKSFVAYKL